MKAAILREVHKPLTVEEVNISTLGHTKSSCAQWRLVSVIATHFYEGLYPTPMPIVLGHESAGVVEAVGSRCTTSSRVTMSSPACPSFAATATIARLAGPICVIVKASSAVKAKSRACRSGNHAPVRQSVLVCRANAGARACRGQSPRRHAIGQSGAHRLWRNHRCRRGHQHGQVPPGSNSGGHWLWVGLSAVQGAVIAGAGRIIAIDTRASKLELAQISGATDLINASEGDPVRTVRDMTAAAVEDYLKPLVQGHRRAGVWHARQRRHCYGDRHDPGGHAYRTQRL